jgi:histidine decarboxylase
MLSRVPAGGAQKAGVDRSVHTERDLPQSFKNAYPVVCWADPDPPSGSVTLTLTDVSGEADVWRGTEPVDVSEMLGDLLHDLERDRTTNIGFPGATDFDYTELAPFLNVLLNNVGDPYVAGAGGAHTKNIEVGVLEFLADMFGAPVDDRWGYLTTGGTEASLYALHLARSVYPNGRVFCSEATHDSVLKAADILALPRVCVRATAAGELDYEDLHQLLAAHRDRPPIVVANIGTTMTEAVDDVPTIKSVLRGLALHEHFVHADGALAGIPLALDEEETVEWGLAPGGVDTVSVSGHKFIGSPFPYGAVLTRRTLRDRVARPGQYTGSPDATITGSRSGLAPLFLWYRLHQLGWEDGLRKRAIVARNLAEYAVRRLNDIGWEAWRNPRGFTVVIKTPPAEVLAEWTLATHGGYSHVVCMPGVSQDQIDRFIDALQASAGIHTLAPVSLPTQRIRPFAVVPTDLDEPNESRRKILNG